MQVLLSLAELRGVYIVVDVVGRMFGGTAIMDFAIGGG